MDFERTKVLIDSLVAQKKLPYIDVRVWKEHAPLFRYGLHADGTVTGKELLFLYSVSKPMTVVCAMRLIQEGKLSLDDAVSKYLPKYADAFVQGEKGEKIPLREPIRIRHLLTMTAGLSYDVFTPATCALMKKNPLAGTVEFVNTFAEHPLSFLPGENYQYSLCHDVIGAVVEVVSGKRFADYMRETLFTPLGMQNTDFHLDETRSLERQYLASENGDIAEMPKENFLVLGQNYDSGGAGVCGCVDDYIRFADALACGGIAYNGYHVLDESMIAKMCDTVVGGINLQNVFTVLKKGEYGYGLGVRVRLHDTEYGLPKGEFGWDGAAGSYLMIDPVNHISVFIGMHVRNWPVIFKGEHLRIVQSIYEEMQK